MESLHNIQVIAIDTNGVLLKDMYGGAIREFIEIHGGNYTPLIEKLIFGSPHTAGGHIMSVVCKKAWTSEEAISRFLTFQHDYAAQFDCKISTSCAPLLSVCNQTGARITCYGGSEKAQIFDKYLSDMIEFFDPNVPYVNMGNHRPGMKKIIDAFPEVKAENVLFIDDLARVFDVCKAVGSQFIGVPSTQIQRELMIAAGVKHIAESARDITLAMIAEMDQRSTMT